MNKKIIVAFIIMLMMVFPSVYAEGVFSFNTDIEKVVINGAVSAEEGIMPLLRSNTGSINIASKVGIGVNNPSRSLEIASDNSQAQLILKDPSANVDSKNWFLQSRLGDFRVGTFDDDITSGGSGNLFSINHNGNIGVGVMSPISKLEVNGNIFGKTLHVQGYAGNENKREPIEVNQGAYISWNFKCSSKGTCDGATYILNNRGYGKGGIVFASLDTDTNKISNEMLRIEKDGNVKINNELTLGGITFVKKTGNNGAISCEQFCRGDSDDQESSWSKEVVGWSGSCVSAFKTETHKPISCDEELGANNPVTCLCAKTGDYMCDEDCSICTSQVCLGDVVGECNNDCNTDCSGKPGLKLPLCEDPSKVTCGESIKSTNGCGPCEGTGTMCKGNNVCTNGKCVAPVECGVVQEIDKRASFKLSCNPGCYLSKVYTAGGRVSASGQSEKRNIYLSGYTVEKFKTTLDKNDNFKESPEFSNGKAVFTPDKEEKSVFYTIDLDGKRPQDILLRFSSLIESNKEGPVYYNKAVGICEPEEVSKPGYISDSENITVSGPGKEITASCPDNKHIVRIDLAGGSGGPNCNNKRTKTPKYFITEIGVPTIHKILKSERSKESTLYKPSPNKQKSYYTFDGLGGKIKSITAGFSGKAKEGCLMNEIKLVCVKDY